MLEKKRGQKRRGSEAIRRLAKQILHAKEFPLRDEMRVELRAELYNVFTHTQFANPDGDFAEAPGVFGTIGSIHGLPRIAQLAAKFYF